MDPQLQTLQQAIASAIEGMTTEHMNWHPPGKWCTAEVLEHLYLTYTGTTKGFSRVDEAGKPLATRATWVQRGQTLVVTRLGYYPSGRQAPAGARPRGLPQDTVRGGILARISEMDDLICRCEEKFGARCKLLDHPILGPLSAPQWRKFHLLHGVHHVKQIRALREMAARPE